MLVVMKMGSSAEDLARVVRAIEECGLHATVVPGGERTAVAVLGNPGTLDPIVFEGLPGVAQVLAVTRPWRLAGREAHSSDTVVAVGPRTIGGGRAIFVVAGPCAVESEAQLLATARALAAAGADALRGGAFKPRSSPYAFQGLGPAGLAMLARARAETGLAVVTEAVDERSLDAVVEHADVIQIGARNMHNYELLKRAGRARKPVLLKRGMSATLEDLLMSAEYLLSEGNPDVILCERGIRTFSRHSRYTLDLSIVPALREATHLPVFVDPSHATGHRDRVPPMARAAVACGADGVMIEVHPDPARALSDGRQALLPDASAELIAQLRELHALAARRTEPVR